MLSVPFSTGDVHGGFSEGRGTIRMDGDDVVLEVQVKLFSLFEQSAETYRFDITDLEEVRHKRGPFRDTLRIRTRPMGLISKVPGANDGVLLLKIGRRHRRSVDQLLDRLDLWVT